MRFPRSFWLLFGPGRQTARSRSLPHPPNRATTPDGNHLNGFPHPRQTARRRFKNYTDYDTDEMRYSSGMCKAGFAGDDAPRAVFRKSNPTDRFPLPPLQRSPSRQPLRRMTSPSFAWLGIALNLSVKLLTKLNSLHCRSSPSPWVNSPPPFLLIVLAGALHFTQPIQSQNEDKFLTCAQYHDWYGSEGLLRW